MTAKSKEHQPLPEIEGKSSTRFGELQPSVTVRQVTDGINSPTEHTLEPSRGAVPNRQDQMGGVDVFCLRDTGSMVSNVTESFTFLEFSATVVERGSW